MHRFEHILMYFYNDGNGQCILYIMFHGGRCENFKFSGYFALLYFIIL